MTTGCNCHTGTSVELPRRKREASSRQLTVHTPSTLVRHQHNSSTKKLLIQVLQPQVQATSTQGPNISQPGCSAPCSGDHMVHLRTLRLSRVSLHSCTSGNVMHGAAGQCQPQAVAIHARTQTLRRSFRGRACDTGVSHTIRRGPAHCSAHCRQAAATQCCGSRRRPIASSSTAPVQPCCMPL